MLVIPEPSPLKPALAVIEPVIIWLPLKLLLPVVAKEPVSVDTATPFSDREPVTRALCIIILYLDYSSINMEKLLNFTKMLI